MVFKILIFSVLESTLAENSFQNEHESCPECILLLVVS